jgi:hypothetical protein
MPIVLTIETGAIVAGANTFVSQAAVETYAANRGLTFAGTDDEKAAAIIKAADYLRNELRFKYRGSLKQYDQPLPFPRVGLTIKNGPSVPDTVVPQAIKDAQAELAVRARSTEIQPDLERGGAIKSESVDVISVTYMDGASMETVIAVVMGYLAPYLRCTENPDFEGFLAQAEYSENFTEGTFDPVTDPTRHEL